MTRRQAMTRRATVAAIRKYTATFKWIERLATEMDGNLGRLSPRCGCSGWIGALVSYGYVDCDCDVVECARCGATWVWGEV